MEDNLREGGGWEEVWGLVARIVLFCHVFGHVLCPPILLEADLVEMFEDVCW